MHFFGQRASGIEAGREGEQRKKAASGQSLAGAGGGSQKVSATTLLMRPTPVAVKVMDTNST